MEQAYQRLVRMASAPDAQEAAIRCIMEQMGRFLKKRDKVLICMPDQMGLVGSLTKEAVLRCGCTPQLLESDRRWLTLLKTAFVTRSDVIVGPPLTLLGLAKVAKHMGTPLFARNVLVGGYPTQNWMVEGIQQGLDCRVWRCYDPGLSAFLAGFSCECGHIHLRSDRYRAAILSRTGEPLPENRYGRVVLSPICDLDLCFETGDSARLDSRPCGCGSSSPRLMDLHTSNGIHPDLSDLWEGFHYWSSVLDCKISRGECGLELELVVFPGEKLPKMPSCARLLVRAWNPEEDEPFPHAYLLKKQLFSQENH